MDRKEVARELVRMAREIERGKKVTASKSSEFERAFMKASSRLGRGEIDAALRLLNAIEDVEAGDGDKTFFANSPREVARDMEGLRQSARAMIEMADIVDDVLKGMKRGASRKGALDAWNSLSQGDIAKLYAKTNSTAAILELIADFLPSTKKYGPIKSELRKAEKVIDRVEQGDDF